MNDIHMAGPKRTSGMAVASLVLAILTIPLVWCCLGYITGPLAILFGFLGLTAYKNGDVTEASKTMAWIGIALSAATLVGFTIFYGAMVLLDAQTS